MPSTYSTNLTLELMATGGSSGAWGDTTNTNLGTLLEQAIVATGTVAMADANQTIAMTNGATATARCFVLNCTGALTAQRNLVVPTVYKPYVVVNSTTGGFGVQVKTTAGTGIVVAPAERKFLYVDGTNVVEMNNAYDALEADALTTASLVLNGSTVTAVGAHTLAVTLTADTAVTLPTSGTLVNSAVTTLASLTTANALTSASALATVGTITSGTWSGTVVGVTKGGTGLATLTANNVMLGNGTSTPGFVAPSTSGNVLTSNGTTWTSAAAVGGYTLLATLTASSSASLTDTTHITSTYKTYMVVFENVVPATSSVELWMRVTTDGVNWIADGNYYSAGPYAVGTVATVSNLGADTANQISLTGSVRKLSNTAAAGAIGTMYLVNPTTTASYTGATWQIADPAGAVSWTGGGSWAQTTAVTGIQFLMSSGNISTGKIKIYGLTAA